ncbi:UDP-glucosyltransferase 2-like [Frankliniella occidentalis]|uniref:UDP-glucosyltransferase 2-like n=2 Tax=Frankliniella occidentalis TaxID=133901 RepID=A0A6J1TFR2_FRAOC|nr:UDP-glucosyltransferase 2-like [Frankliniella occidentalis]
MVAPTLPATVIALVIIGAALPPVVPFRVLGLFPFQGHSHNIMSKSLMEGLADRGHEVVMLSSLPLMKPRANYTDLSLAAQLPPVINTMTYDQLANAHGLQLPVWFGEAWGASWCRTVFESQHFQDIMKGKYGKFDVVFTEVFASDCWAVVPFKLNVPLISLDSQPDHPWMHDRVGAINNPSYLFSTNVYHVGPMNLWQRARNTYQLLAAQYLFKVHIQDPSDEVVREFFGADTPPISEMLRSTSLVMINGHVSFTLARPLPPNTLEVGGLHLKNRRPDRSSAPLESELPELSRWMDGAERGVILMALGSIVTSSSLPKPAVQAFLDAFAALGPHYRVVWKYEADDIADSLPPNVRIASWLPQFDVLAHPKTVLFVGHAGLMGSSEAMFLGVPLVCIPMFSDQPFNAALFEYKGISVTLDHRRDLNKDTILAVLRKILDTDKYRSRSREIAALFSDRPRSAMDEAVWWTEYVVRHRGARHLRPLGADLPLYQYLLLDVAAVVLAVGIVTLVLAWLLTSAALRALQAALRSRGNKRKND